MYTVGQARGIGAFLVDRRAAVGASYFPPAYAGYFTAGACARADRLVGEQRLVAAHVAVREPEERALPVTLVVDPVRCTGLRDAVTTTAAESEDRVVRLDGNSVSKCEG